MAELKSTEVTAKDASSGEKYNNLSGVKVATWGYITTGDEVNSDYIVACELPVGSKVIGHTTAYTGTFGASAAIDIGTTEAGTDIDAAISIATDGITTAWVAPVACTTVYVEIGNVGSGNASDVLNGTIFYI